jgi:NADPH:quinone reductase-like Zn-dependent oxidoreductase
MPSSIFARRGSAVCWARFGTESALPMKAIVYKEYGTPDVLRLVDVDKPSPADDEVLIEVLAASLNALDWRMLRGKPAIARVMAGGLIKPKRQTPGADLAGRVAAVGAAVTEFRAGDEVFGVRGKTGGALAEFLCTTPDRLVMKPRNASFAQAAAVPVAGITALQGLRDAGRIQPGQKVLVDGASGGVGTFAVQIAKSFGAEVTAVCSTANVATARSIGADHVIDYKQEDFTRNGQRYDLIFAANAHRSIFDYKRALTPNGIYVMAGGGGVEILQGMLLGPCLSLAARNKMGIAMAKVSKKDLTVLKDLLESGKIAPVLDRTYTLRDAADALRYVEQGHARGKVIVTIEH